MGPLVTLTLLSLHLPLRHCGPRLLSIGSHALNAFLAASMSWGWGCRPWLCGHAPIVGTRGQGAGKQVSPASVSATHSGQPQAKGQASSATQVMAALQTLPTSPSVPVSCPQVTKTLPTCARAGQDLGQGLHFLTGSHHLSLFGHWVVFDLQGSGALVLEGTFEGSRR